MKPARALLHFFIAFAVVAPYQLAGRRLPSLTRHPWLYGPLYGLLIPAIGVGLPAALFARASRSNA